MADQPEIGIIDLISSDPRDFSRQKCKPQFEVLPTAPPALLFELCYRNETISHRKCVAVYLGLGEWLILMDDGRRFFCHMGRFRYAVVIFLRGLILDLLGPVETQENLQLG
ncbi:MAG: hypothetical protein QM496_05720 [Verrucomicrobiota bacterium]